jgi:OFA family oxalate/formate antiporter-like MFS transporter
MSAFWLSAPFSVVAAYALRRIGLRRLVAIGGVIEIIAMLAMVRASSATEFYVLRFVMGVGKVLMVTPLPVAAARCLPSTAGLGIAIALCGWHVGGLVMAPVTAEFVIRYGWRSALICDSALFVAGLSIAAYLLRTRSIPEVTAADVPPQKAGGELSNTDARPIRRSRASLIVIGAATLAYYAGYAGLLGQLAPLLANAGFSEHVVGQLTGSVAFSAAVIVLVAGVVTQYVPARVSGCVALILMSFATLGATLLIPGASLPSGILFVSVVGALIGGGDPIIIDALRLSIDVRRFDRAYGYWYLLCLTALSIAPFAVGVMFDHFGTYRVAFLSISAAALTSAFAWFAFVRNPVLNVSLRKLHVTKELA